MIIRPPRISPPSTTQEPPDAADLTETDGEERGADTLHEDIAAMGPDAVVARSEGELVAALHDLRPRKDKPPRKTEPA